MLRIRFDRRWARAIALAAAAACDPGAHTTGINSDAPPVTQPAPFVVSSPVPMTSAPVRAAVASQNAGSTVVFVSLPPGAIPNGITANISVQRTGSSMVAPIVGGGFDPVALAADVGDTIAVDVRTSASASTTSFRFKVPPVAPPVIVRTDPPLHKRDVPLNKSIVIVFSTPIDPSTLTDSAVSLGHDTTVVAGQLSFADVAHTSVLFSPAALLAGETDYTLHVTTAIRDLNGVPLTEPLEIQFTTGIDPVATVAVTPNSASLGINATTQLAVTAKDAIGIVLAGRPAAWSTSNPALATVSSTGLVTGVTPGAVTITATVEGHTGTAAITVTPVASVTVSPNSATIAPDVALQMVASALDALGHPLPRAITWASSNAAAATVTNAGIVRGVSIGTTTITATADGVAGSAVITVGVNPNGVASVDVTPGSASVAVNATTQLTATPRDASGNALTGLPAVWTTSNAALATVTATGLVSGISAGTVTITATIAGHTGVAAITVTPETVASVTVSPTSSTITVGRTVQLVASTQDTQGLPLQRSITWASSNTAVATVSSAGVVTGVTLGAATITATADDMTGSAVITVGADVATVGVTPTSASVDVNATTQFTATPKDANGNTLTDRPVTWTTGNAAVANVASNGVVTGFGAGTTTVSATIEGKTGTAAVTVTVNAVASVSVAPATLTLPIGGSAVYVATMKNASGVTITGRQPVWTTSNAAVATVSGDTVGAGLSTVEGVSVGTATITATIDGKVGIAVVTVVPDVVASVVISPNPVVVAVGSTLLLDASARTASGWTLPRAITWASSNTSVATVTDRGIVTGVHLGATTITASADGVTGSAVVSVTQTIPGTQLYQVSGVVTDDAGSPIANVEIYLDYNPTSGLGFSHMTAFTDAAGAYSFSINAQPGGMHGPPGTENAFAVAYVWGPDGYEYDARYLVSTSPTFTQNFRLYRTTRIAVGETAPVTIAPDDAFCNNNTTDMHPWPTELVCRVVRVPVLTDGVLTVTARSTQTGGAAPGLVIEKGLGYSTDVQYGVPGVATVPVAAGMEVIVYIQVPWGLSASRSFVVTTSLASPASSHAPK